MHKKFVLPKVNFEKIVCSGYAREALNCKINIVENEKHVEKIPKWVYNVNS